MGLGTACRSPRNDRVRQRGAGCRGGPGADPVRNRRGLPGGHDAGRLLEHRGAVRDRSADRRPGELRQQVPRRGGRLHGNRPRRDLRRRRGNGRPLPAVPAHTPGPGAQLARGRDRGGNPRHPRRAAAGARPQSRPAGDPRQRLRHLPGGDPGRHGEDERTRGRPADRGSGDRVARERRPRPQPHRCRPRPTRTRSRGLAARPQPDRCLACACQASGRWP